MLDRYSRSRYASLSRVYAKGRRFSLIFALSLSLFAVSCATQSGGASDKNQSGQVSSSTDFEDAALAPLTDLNIRRTPIPEKLKAIETPYAPVSFNCATIAKEVSELTQILGPDRDFVRDSEEEDEDLADLASSEATDYAYDTVESTTTAFIPFRSLVRRATGATAHEKALRDAYLRGVERRSYLKGIGKVLSCLPPASPTPPKSENERIEYKGATPGR